MSLSIDNSPHTDDVHSHGSGQIFGWQMDTAPESVTTPSCVDTSIKWAEIASCILISRETACVMASSVAWLFLYDLSDIYSWPG
jgi:hypothetical protein